MFHPPQKKTPVISIITVTFNAIETIIDTFQSVFNQTFTSFEFIIIDGGSTDGTLDIIKSKLNNISYWVSEKDNGIYDAMNKGISVAKGDWIIFLNSGDIFCNNDVLKNIFSYSINDKTQIIYGNAKVKYTNNILRPPAKIRKKYFYANTICHQSIIFKKNVFEKNGFFNLEFKIIADRVWLLAAAVKRMCFQYINLEICVWEEEGFSKRNSSLFHHECKILKMAYFNFFERFIFIWELRFHKYRRRIFFAKNN